MTEAAAAPGGRSAWGAVEDHALALALGAMMVLPLIEAVLRKTFQTGISNQTSIVQHLVLIAGMLGAVIAARQQRLLTFGFGDNLLKGRLRPVGRAVSGAVTVALSTWLCVAAFRFVLSERRGGAVLAYGLPVWLVQLVLPLGFALITVWMLRNSSETWRGRAVTLFLAGILVLIAGRPPLPAQQLVAPALGLIGVAAVLGAPLFIVLGGAGLVLFWGDASPIGSLTVDHYGLVTNPILPTVPLFTLAGYFLAEGGASRRLIRLFQALVGNVRGGPAILVALVCAFFTSFTGASGVTILALGGLLMPVLLNAGYSERTTMGLLTGTGSLGLLIPPCLPLIFYAVFASVDIRDMFLGGIIPGILLIVLTIIWGISQAPKVTVARQAFAWRDAGAALWDAKWEVLVPVVALGGLFSGLATPVEAAALTAFYAFVVETFIYRDLSVLRDARRVTTEAGVLVGGVLLILGVALGFTNYLAFAEIPARAVDWVTASVHSRWAFLLLLNLFLIVVGMLMDVYSAIVIVVPLIVPLGRAFGVDPIHLGIVFLANLELGFLTPPVGVNLFLSSLRFNKPLLYVIRCAVPMMIVFLIGVFLITYIPAMTTTLPNWFGHRP